MRYAIEPKRSGTSRGGKQRFSHPLLDASAGLNHRIAKFVLHSFPVRMPVERGAGNAAAMVDRAILRAKKVPFRTKQVRLDARGAELQVEQAFRVRPAASFGSIAPGTIRLKMIRMMKPFRFLILH